MNQLPDVEPVLRAYLADTGDRAPDRVLIDVVARIANQPRRAWRLRGRHFMNTYAKLAAAAAAVLVVAVVGWQLLPGGSGPGSPSPVPTASPSEVATAAPSPTAGPPTVMRPVTGDPLTWAIRIPEGWVTAGGWLAYPTELGTAGDGKNDASEVVGDPDGLAVSFVSAPQVFLDSCDFGSMSDARSVAALVAVIRAKADWVVSTPVDVSISGFAGQRLDATLPADLSVCEPDVFLAIGQSGTENGFYAQGPSQLLRLWILDVEGRVVLLSRQAFAATPAARLAEATNLIETSVITP